MNDYISSTEALYIVGPAFGTFRILPESAHRTGMRQHATRPVSHLPGRKLGYSVMSEQPFVTGLAKAQICPPWFISSICSKRRLRYSVIGASCPERAAQCIFDNNNPEAHVHRVKHGGEHAYVRFRTRDD
jgi:hypothetical protein